MHLRLRRCGGSSSSSIVHRWKFEVRSFTSNQDNWFHVVSLGLEMIKSSRKMTVHSCRSSRSLHGFTWKTYNSIRVKHTIGYNIGLKASMNLSLLVLPSHSSLWRPGKNFSLRCKQKSSGENSPRYGSHFRKCPANRSWSRPRLPGSTRRISMYGFVRPS